MHSDRKPTMHSVLGGPSDRRREQKEWHHLVVDGAQRIVRQICESFII